MHQQCRTQVRRRYAEEVGRHIPSAGDGDAAHERQIVARDPGVRAVEQFQSSLHRNEQLNGDDLFLEFKDGAFVR
jgi:hypothetical protein